MDQTSNFRNAYGTAANMAGANKIMTRDENNLAINNAKNDALLKAYGDVQRGNAMANARTGENMGRIGNFAQGSSNILETEAQAATRPNGFADIANLLNAGGQIMAAKAGAKDKPK
jgi:hypothetical protein